MLLLLLAESMLPADASSDSLVYPHHRYPKKKNKHKNSFRKYQSGVTSLDISYAEN